MGKLMEIIKETQYLAFGVVEQPKEKKTKWIAIINVHHEEIIGEIRWFSRWRQYCFYPYHDTVWNTTCMEDIQTVIKELMNERKKK